MGNELIYKIISKEDLKSFRHEEIFSGVGLDLEHGFIHFSKADQIDGTLKKYFQGGDGYVILVVDAKTLGSDLRWEPSASGAIYPHLYGKLTLRSVIAAVPVTRRKDGSLIIPK
ncbi:DUF952 domain-containing protein [Zymomonas mobilis]|uniref:DUF952 domain-containing protein n=1 Tax=Zymomonas mobilis TaxID=542 RepID=UPI0039EAD182